MDSIETGNLLVDERFPRLCACERAGCNVARVAYAPASWRAQVTFERTVDIA